jgi:hypothetical protein
MLEPGHWQRLRRRHRAANGVDGKLLQGDAGSHGSS